ncbi:hypothetical protein PGTUg99_035127 [Puccinia graminis f. sp. tritici]|uniref:Uncharacterized protein n=1 Tax=Puccinia graminis f. sp. tritici TaxID=56615 RepID=A0A5B0SA37_PUCGR|nr:hypothetical protein PGTUg99_035127 [Puccinia graminis f. sp. tritici]
MISSTLNSRINCLARRSAHSPVPHPEAAERLSITLHSRIGEGKTTASTISGLTSARFGDPLTWQVVNISHCTSQVTGLTRPYPRGRSLNVQPVRDDASLQPDLTRELALDWLCVSAIAQDNPHLLAIYPPASASLTASKERKLYTLLANLLTRSVEVAVKYTDVH